MDADQMRAEFETYAEQRNWNVRKYHGSYYWAEAARAWQVWQAAYAAGRKAEQGEVERLRDENEWMGIAGQQMARHLAEAKAELAAAKAASVVPVKWKSVERFFKSGADLGNQWGIEFWFDTKEQRDKFGKWMKERGEG